MGGHSDEMVRFERKADLYIPLFGLYIADI